MKAHGWWPEGGPGRPQGQSAADSPPDAVTLRASGKGPATEPPGSDSNSSASRPHLESYCQ